MLFRRTSMYLKISERILPVKHSNTGNDLPLRSQDGDVNFSAQEKKVERGMTVLVGDVQINFPLTYQMKECTRISSTNCQVKSRVSVLITCI